DNVADQVKIFVLPIDHHRTVSLVCVMPARAIDRASGLVGGAANELRTLCPVAVKGAMAARPPYAVGHDLRPYIAFQKIEPGMRTVILKYGQSEVIKCNGHAIVVRYLEETRAVVVRNHAARPSAPDK